MLDRVCCLCRAGACGVFPARFFITKRNREHSHLAMSAPFKNSVLSIVTSFYHRGDIPSRMVFMKLYELSIVELL